MPDFEVVVVDTASTDRSVEIVRTMQQNDDRIRLIKAPSSLVAPAARNLGLAHAKGAFIATLDQDDVLLADSLRQQLNCLQGEEDLAAVGGRIEEIDADGRSILAANQIQQPESPETVRWVLPFWCPSTTSANMYRAAALNTFDGFDERYPLCDDYALLSRMTKAGGVRVLPSILVQYRRHDAQTSIVRRRRQAVDVVNLARLIVSERLGYEPPFEHLGAAIAPSAAQFIEHLAGAKLLCRQLMESQATRRTREEDRLWIEADHGHRLDAIEDALRVLSQRELLVRMDRNQDPEITLEGGPV